MRQKRVKELKRLAIIVAKEQIETPGGKKIQAAFGKLALAKMTDIMFDAISKTYHKTPRPMRSKFFKAAHGGHLNPALRVQIPTPV